jgi:dTDP-4-dehydrorhamnose reductase
MNELELWAGAECTVNRVGDSYFDQLRRTGSDGRLDDLERLAELGVRAVRFPVLWERVAPRSLAEADFAWSDARLPRLRELGIRPIVGLLHHGSGPRHTDLCDPAFAEQFQGYAELVAQRYPWVDAYTPVNEPLTTARFSALYGHWYPHRRDTRSFLLALTNQVRATSAAMRAIRSVNPRAELVQTEDAGRTFSTAELQHQAAYENLRRWLSFDLLFGKVDASHPMRRHLEEHAVPLPWLDELVAEPCAPDLLGLNYYVTSDRFLDQRLERYPQWTWGGNGRERYADVEAVRVMAAGIRDHAAVLAETWERYRAPLAITEVHLGCSREHQLRWFEQAWASARRSRECGVDVRAVTLWSAFGSVDWSSLVTRDLGHYETGAYDVRGPAPRRTALAELAAQCARGQTPTHPLLSGKGWWQCRERLCYIADAVEPEAAAAREPESAPLLLFGEGPLARRVMAACERRGVRVVLPQPGQSAEELGAEPWGVVVAGLPGSSAAATSLLAGLPRAARELPVLAFSSDLLFDGRAARPYVETDTPSATRQARLWRAWERALTRFAPRALVIRTGPLLDPECHDDALAQMLRQLEDGALVRLPDEEHISPAYLPHLVDAALDLLVDGEKGIWHAGSCSFCSPLELARAVAERVSLPTARLVGGDPSHPGLSRGRHSRRALSSLRGWTMPELGLALNDYVENLRSRIGTAA